MYSTLKVLIVEDDPITRAKFKVTLSPYYHCEFADSVCNAKELLISKNYDVAVLDKNVKDGITLPLIPEIKNKDKNTAIIMHTSDDDFSSVNEALALGANDYVVKSQSSYQDIAIRIPLAFKKNKEDLERLHLTEKFKSISMQTDLIGSSKETLELKLKTLKLKDTNSNVLITGESGTGKEVIAKIIYESKEDFNRPFFAINCGAIQDSLFESEMFGHVKGAFTGAIKDKIGLFELSDGGDLFLDEIGDLTLALQVKLLRALENGEFTPVGSTKTKTSKVRIIAATNKNLEEFVADGKFREDLYYRLNVIHLKTTPLRERPEDIIDLARHFTRIISKGDSKISDSVLDILTKQYWNGNVRELRNHIERAIINSKSEGRNSIELKDFSIDTATIKKLTGKSKIIVASIPGLPKSFTEISNETYREFIDSCEALYLKNAMEINADSSVVLAEKLGITPATFYRKLKHLGLAFESKVKRGRKKTATASEQIKQIARHAG